MENTINGRTPEEIKARIDYCRNVKTAGDCMSCPYVEDADVCASDFMFDSFDYIQQLERERDAAVERCVNADDVSAGYYQKIQQLESAQPKWISVDERLPGYGTGMFFIVCRDDGEVSEARFEIYNGRWYEQTTEGLWEIDVTHWMPLPEPPKEG